MDHEDITKEINKILPPIKWRKDIQQDEFIDIPMEAFDYINARKEVLSFVSKTIYQQREDFKKMVGEMFWECSMHEDLHRDGSCKDCKECLEVNVVLDIVLKSIEKL